MDLFRRYDANPVLEASDWPGEVNAVFNPAAVGVDGETLLLVRVEDRTGHLAPRRRPERRRARRAGRSSPSARCCPTRLAHAERFGIEDPRVTQIGDDFLIVCTGYSTDGPLIFLVATRDFRELRPARGPAAAAEQGRCALPATGSAGATRCSTVRCPVATGSGWGDLALVQPRPRALGRPSARSSRPGGRGSWDVGQDRARAAAAPHAPRAGSSSTTASARPRPGRSTAPGSRCSTASGRSGCSPGRPTGCSAPQAPYERVGDVGMNHCAPTAI